MSMTEDQFASARDITPTFAYITKTIDGEVVRIPCLLRESGSMYMSEDHGMYIDSDGVEWLVGTQAGELVKRRL